jgi:hypothetical protein
MNMISLMGSALCSLKTVQNSKTILHYSSRSQTPELLAIFSAITHPGELSSDEEEDANGRIPENERD